MTVYFEANNIIEEVMNNIAVFEEKTLYCG